MVLVALAILALAADRARLWDVLRRNQRERVALVDHLHDWATAPAQRAYLASPQCHPVRVPGGGYRPYLRYWLDVPARAVAFRFVGDAVPARGTVLLPTPADRYQRRMIGSFGERARARVLAQPRFAARFRLVSRESRWELYAAPRCRRAAPRAIRSS